MEISGEVRDGTRRGRLLAPGRRSVTARWGRHQRSSPPAHWSWALCAGVLAAVLMAVRQLAVTPVGMANNGDAYRLMCKVGADSGGPPAGSTQWDFVRLVYPALPPGTGCDPYRTSQYLQLRLGVWVHDLLGLPGALDMRVLVVQDSLLVGLAVGVMVCLLRRARWWARIGVPAALFLVLADATFADYAASPFSEPAAFIGLVTVALAGVAATSGRHRRLAFLVATAGAALAVASKMSTVTLALPFVLLLVSRRLRLGRLTACVLPAVGVAAVASAAMWVSGAEAPPLEKINVSNTITMMIMPQSGDPARVATDLGLPSSFGRYSGSHWWSPKPIYLDPRYPAYDDRITRDNLARYLLHHPDAAVRLVTNGADDYLAYRVDYLGNYPEHSGHPPGSQECRLCLLPTVPRAFGWSGFPGIVTYWLACLAGAVLLIRRSAPGTIRRGFAVVAVMLVGVTVVQYLTAVLGEGNEITKHLSVALLAAALAPVWLAAAAVTSGRPAIEVSWPRVVERDRSPDAEIEPAGLSREAADQAG
jgi:hypothetical protein